MAGLVPVDLSLGNRRLEMGIRRTPGDRSGGRGEWGKQARTTDVSPLNDSTTLTIEHTEFHQRESVAAAERLLTIYPIDEGQYVSIHRPAAAWKRSA